MVVNGEIAEALAVTPARGALWTGARLVSYAAGS
jgi:hypothetical protein